MRIFHSFERLEQKSRPLMFGMKLSSFLVALFIVATTTLVIPVECRSLFGGRFVAAALFGKNNADDDGSQETEPPKSPVINTTPPPPPPGRPHQLPVLPTMLSKPETLQEERLTTPPGLTNPPPPPPKPDSKKSNDGEEVSHQISMMATPSVSQLSAPPRSQKIESDNPQAPLVQEQSNELWSQTTSSSSTVGPQQWEGSWGDQQHVQHQQYPYYSDDTAPFNPQQQQQQGTHHQWPSLKQQLEDSIAREHGLFSQVQNLTETIGTLHQQDQLHLRQMDVLTERIMDAEAQLARERNRALEYQSNCTELSNQVAVLHQELADWQSRCADFADQNHQNEGRIKELKKSLDEARIEAENLAISIENDRTRDKMDDTRRKKKKSRSLLGWIFSLIISTSDPEAESEDDENKRDLAKSTLLRALQRERNNVEELEAAVSSLQQNNSAIAEMVKSRDLIIDELNDRVAVFEEDKVVLKAALKQLQKEMKEEAPRSQKLIDDLDTAREEVARLAEEIESLIESHQNEISSLEHLVAQKEKARNATESNLTLIGQYVDTLEERLASFAIARRDIEVREKKCKETEEHAKLVEKERDNLMAKHEELQSEQNQIKIFLEELVQERTNLQQENSRLAKESESLKQGAQRSRETLASLENNMKRLDKETAEWKSRALELEKELNITKEAAGDLAGGAQAYRAENEHLKKQLEELQALNQKLHERIEEKAAELSMAKEQVEAKSSELRKNEEALKGKGAEIQLSQEKIKEITDMLLEREEELKVKAAELAKLQTTSREQLLEVEEEFEMKAAELAKLQTTSREQLLELEEELEVKKAEITELQTTIRQQPKVMAPQDLPVLVKAVDGSRSATPESQSSVNGTLAAVETDQNKTLPPPPPSKPLLAGPVMQPPPLNITQRQKASPPQARPEMQPPPLNSTQRQNASPPQATKREVPFRQVRKLFSKVTGIHGAFRGPSQKGMQKGPSLPRPSPLNTTQNGPTPSGPKTISQQHHQRGSPQSQLPPIARPVAQGKPTASEWPPHNKK